MNTSAHIISHANIIELEWTAHRHATGGEEYAHVSRGPDRIHARVGHVYTDQELQLDTWHWTAGITPDAWTRSIADADLYAPGLHALSASGYSSSAEEARRDAQDWVNRFSVMVARERGSNGHSPRITP